MTDDEEFVIRQEKQLLDPAVRGDRALLEALYHPNFVEYGSSGRVWTHESSINGLVSNPQPGLDSSDGFYAQHFSAHTIDINTIQVRFETGDPGRLVRRTSWWVRAEGGRWLVLFHQGTVVPEPPTSQPSISPPTHAAPTHLTQTQLLAAIDHVQLAIPAGGEPEARQFWCGVFGLVERDKPTLLAARGGAWFATPDGHVQIHVGVAPLEAGAQKAHPAFRTRRIDQLARLLAEHGYETRWDTDIPEVKRFHTDDPFGNRLEFVAE